MIVNKLYNAGGQCNDERVAHNKLRADSTKDVVLFLDFLIKFEAYKNVSCMVLRFEVWRSYPVKDGD